MKKIIGIVALILGISPFAQAQVYFGSGSARPVNPGAAKRDLDRQAHTRPRVNAHQVLVPCRDGSKHSGRLCRRHGGVAVR
jgi:hypothetical protein